MRKVFNLTESAIPTLSRFGVFSEDDVFSEAVFKGGKKHIEPMVKSAEALKNRINEMIDVHKKAYEKSQVDGVSINTKECFNVDKLWKDQVIKDFEDSIIKVFGFRYVEFTIFKDEYDPKKDKFTNPYINACIWNFKRFPIEGLVSDDGLYDKSHSLKATIAASLQLIHILTVDEFVGIVLHEIGHGIDPAISDISYTGTNVLMKYLSEGRKGKLNEAEKAFVKDIGDESEAATNILFAMTVKSKKGASSIFKKLFSKDKFKAFENPFKSHRKKWMKR